MRRKVTASSGRRRLGAGARRGAGLIFATLALASCGGGHSSATRTDTPRRVTELDVFSSLSLSGADRAETQPIVNGIRLALVESAGRAGPFRIDYHSRDDAAPGAVAWSPARTALNARTVAEDSRAILYIGEFDSAASEVSIPILNQASIPQISPSNTYVGLTAPVVGGPAGLPGILYPTRRRTFLRLAPSDTAQAAAGLIAMHQDGCRRVALAGVAEDGAQSLKGLLARQQGLHGVRVVSDQTPPGDPASLARYAQSAQAARVDCVYFTGGVGSAAEGVGLIEALAAQIPTVRVYTSARLCTPAFTDSAESGLPVALARHVQCTLPGPSLTSSPAGRAFLAAYRATYGGSDPGPYGAYGYEAMKLGLQAIGSLGAQGDDRTAVLHALLTHREPSSPIGAFAFAGNGDAMLSGYGLYGVGADGRPRFEREIVPSPAPA